MTSSTACYIVNTLWSLLNSPTNYRFDQACRSVKECQENYLIKLLSRNASTAYGDRHGFKHIQSIEHFQNTVPLTTYEDYRPYIDRIAQGEKSVLTCEDVKLFEPSSGSSSPEKLIPYTDSLRRDFQQGIGPWITSLYRQYPQTKHGKTYWSISPQNHTDRTHGKIPVGFDNDSSYLGFLGKWLFSQVAVHAPEISAPTDDETFKTRTLLALLAERNLRLISVWSPTFLTLLCEYFLENEKHILSLLSSSPNQQTRKRVEEIGRRKSRYDFNQIWPGLEVISCWTDSSSREPARRLQSYFPGSVIQGKGLLATEAFVSFPYLPGYSPVLAVTSHFFEFQAQDGQCFPAHQVEQGESYSVVVTTSGGLYRYRLGDYVLVKGFIGQAPCLEFTGKSDLVSDLFGEKIHAAHAAESINSVVQGYDFAMLAPDNIGIHWNYTLYIESDRLIHKGAVALLEQKLCENPNYRHCIRTGQLSSVRIFRVNKSAALTYTTRLSQKGMRLGDIKPAPLSKLNNWSDYFTGEYETS